LMEACEGLLGRQVVMHDKKAMQEQLMRCPYHLRPYVPGKPEAASQRRAACSTGAVSACGGLPVRVFAVRVAGWRTRGGQRVP